MAASRFQRFRSRNPRFVRIALLLVIFGSAFAVGLAYAGWALVCRGGQCPTVAVLDDFVPRQTSKVFAADGRFVAEIGIERRTLAKIGDIPPIVKNAFLVTEDKRFYKHSGIDWVRVPSAIIADLKARSFSQGFSTITMQLARNIFPERISRDKNLVRKLKEAKVARAIEDRYPKDKILELYLNQIYLGSGAHGVETAAQRYFGKSVKDLNLAEAATLAALPKGPNRYDPRRFPDRAVQRRNTIIELMRREGMVSDADASLARAYPLTLANKTESGELAPYFVEWVRQQLDQQFGQQLYEQGLKVYTTLDLDLQSAAERAVEGQLRAIESGRYGAYNHVSYEAYLANAEGTEERGAANSPYLQGAFIAMDPRTGAVRALVGGRDFDDSKFNRATQALRQPGSTFKPIVYADAIQNGRPPTYPLDDSPLTVPNSGGGDWTPQNFDGKYEGRIPMRRALYMSRNIPTIRLGMELGEQSVIDMARKFGISSPLPPYPSLHIGAADVYPIEMVSAYTAFASLGTRAAPIAILRVENQKGDVLWAPEQQKVAVLSQEEAWLMVDMMKDVVRRGTAAGSVGSQFSLPAGGKTGTTNDGNDVWFLGYTSDLVAGVWMGFDRPEKIKGNAQGGVLAAPAWTAFMREAYRRKPSPPDWPRPAGIVSAEVDVSTNLLRSPFCPPAVVARDYFIAGTEPTRVCDVHNGSATYDTLLYPPGTTPPPGTQPYPGRGAAPTGATVFTPRRDSTAPRDTNNPFAIPPRRPAPRDTSRPRPDTTRHDTLRTPPRAPRR